MIVSEVNYSQLEGRIDSKFYSPEYIELIKWLDCINTVSVSELCKPSTLRRNPIGKPDTSFRYIEVENVNQETGLVTHQNILGHDAPSRARKVVKSQNVIVSMVRPDKGVVGVIPDYLDDSICSTGFCVLIPEKIDAISLFCLLKSSIVRKQIVRKTTSSMYPTITEDDILSAIVPCTILQSTVFKESVNMVREAIQQQREALEKLNRSFDYLENNIKDRKTE